jgi:hypothetical protein
MFVMNRNKHLNAIFGLLWAYALAKDYGHGLKA